MEYEKLPPEWENVGTEPPEGSRTWVANQKPPAGWFNWLFDAIYKCFSNVKTYVDGLELKFDQINGHKHTGAAGDGPKIDAEKLSGKTLTEIIAMFPTSSILKGTIANGGTIPLPVGFTQDQCIWFIIPRQFYNYGSYDIHEFECYDNESRVVTLLSEEHDTGNTGTYIIIGRK
jgi:hypothetical protein